MRKFVTVVATLLAFAVPADAATSQSGELKFIDLVGDFDRVWGTTSSVSEASRAAAFREAFEPLLGGFYDPDRVKDFIPADRYDEMILRGLRAYPEQRERILRVSREFNSMVGPAKREFEATFGAMTGYSPVYIVHSLGEFDGGTRDLKSGSHLMFGADVIAKLYQDRPIKPFLQHELFHLLHARTFGDCELIYCNLWREGLATYTAASLNPGADDDALGLTLPKPIRPAVDPRFAEAVCEVRARLDSDKPDDYAPLFFGSKNLPGFPPRMGYYIGYRVAQDIGRTRDLKQLAAMTPAQVRPLIVASLDDMATCDPKDPLVERG